MRFREGLFADAADVNVERTTWHPTPAQMKAYMAREVELARGNLAVLRARSPDRARRPATAFVLETTHSLRTLREVQRTSGLG